MPVGPNPAEMTVRLEAGILAEEPSGRGGVFGEGCGVVALGPQLWAFFGAVRHGDFRAGTPGIDARRAAVTDLAWSGLTQAHGSTVVAVPAVVGETDRKGDFPEGDALITCSAGLALCVLGADCAPVLLAAEDGWLAAVHAGWRGLATGVLQAAAGRLDAEGATGVSAWLGPCIHPCCYEFGTDGLADMAARFGPTVVAQTTRGTPALDLRAAVAAVLAREGIPLDTSHSRCTSCYPAGLPPTYFSFRARQDQARQPTAIWRTADPEARP